MKAERRTHRTRVPVRVLRGVFAVVVLVSVAFTALAPAYRSDPLQSAASLRGGAANCVLPGCDPPVEVVDVEQFPAPTHQGWVLPRSPGREAPAAAETDGTPSSSWWADHGAVPVGGSLIRFDLIGSGAGAARISDLTVASSCGDPLTGTLFFQPPEEPPSYEGHGAHWEEDFEPELVDETDDSGVPLFADLAEGTVLTKVPVELRVDAWHPGGPYFAERGFWISPGERLRVTVEVEPGTEHCEFVLEVAVTRGALSWTAPVDDDGAPFQVTAVAGDGTGAVDFTRYEEIRLHTENGWT